MFMPVGRLARVARTLVILALLVGLVPLSATAADPPKAPLSKANPKPPAGSLVDAAGNPYVADQILVRFKPTAGIAASAAAHKTVGAKKLRDVQGVDGLELAKLPKGASVLGAVARYRENPAVAYAQPNYLHHIEAVPTDPRFDELWGMDNTGQTGGTPDADIDAPEAWDEQTGSSDVIVAVIDTGVDYNHPDLKNNMWTNPGEIAGNGIDDDGNGFVDDVHGYDFVNYDGDPMDDHSHGTHCSGTIGAEANNGVGVAGVSQDVSIMAMKFLTADGWGDTAAAIDCINYADMMGADIMSNSWGGGGYEQALADAIAGTDALFVAAAGNDSMDTDMMPNYPSCYDSPNVVAVGATDHNDELAWFSNWGAETVDVFAPGDQILSTVYGPPPSFTPDVVGTTLINEANTLAGCDISTYQRDPWTLSTDVFSSTPSSFALMDYRDNEDSWIKLSDPIDLSGYAGAMLQFDALLDTEPGLDILNVWASTNNVDWSPLGSYSGDSGGFSQYQADMMSYAGNATVYVAFSFVSDSTVSSGEGFTGVAVDDIELIEVAPLFSDDFTTLDNWDVTNFAEKAWKLDTEWIASPPSSAGNLDYVDNEDAWLTMATPLDLSGVSGGVAMTCNLLYAIEPGVDILSAVVSTDGATWTTLTAKSGFSGDMMTPWTPTAVDLSSVAGEPSVRLAFRLESNEMFSAADGLLGVAVDDVNVMTGTWTEPDYTNAYAVYSGTSMATPHAAGIAALTLAQWPNLDAEDLKASLMKGADPVPALDGLCVSGGRANAHNSIQDLFGPDIAHDAVAEYTAKATINLSASDPNGVASISYSIDGDDPVVVEDFTAQIVCDIPGDRVLTYWAEDNLGNVTDPVDVAFHITRGIPGFKAVAGSDRFATSVKASQMSFADGADTVVIATGRNWPDALGGTALAGAVDGPMLLTDTNSLPGNVADEIERLGATSAYVLGGSSAVADAAFDDIEAVVGAGNVTRIFGTDRYVTARRIADEVIALGGAEYDGTAFVATGANYPDALAAAPIAARNAWPLLLADPEGSISVPTEVSSAVILGGEGAVPAGIEAALQGRLGENNVMRKGASDRYGTASLIAAWSVSQGMYWEGVGITTGTNFADALSGGAMLGARRSVMLLTPGDDLAPAARAPLSVNKEMIQTVHFVGGTSAVSQSVRAEVLAAID